MSLYGWIAIGVAAVIIISLLLRKDGGLAALLKEAVADGNIDKLVEAAAQMPEGQRFMHYQKAISSLWEDWHRGLAIRLIKVFAVGYSDEKICQYWLRQAMEVEPDLAASIFDKEFLEQYFIPEVAKECCQTSS